MNRFITLILFLVLYLTAGHSYAQSGCSLTKVILPEIEKIRGLELGKIIDCEVKNKEQVLQFVTSELDKKEVKEKTKLTEIILKKLQVIPDNFDYDLELKNLYTSQIGGYYDPRTKKYVMASWMPDAVQPTIAAHELVHALQDKAYDLKTLLEDPNLTLDEQLSRSALIEGDATLAMYDYTRNTMGQGSLIDQKSIDSYIFQTVIGMFITGSGSNVPKLITSMLVFPYTSGFRFAHNIARSENRYKGIDRVFSSPPASTREILYPDIFLARINNNLSYIKEAETLKTQKDILNDLQQAPKNSADSKIYTETLGSFFMSAWLTHLGIPEQKSTYFAKSLIYDQLLIVDNNRFNSWGIIFDNKSKAVEFQSLFGKLKSISHGSLKASVVNNSNVVIIR